MLKESTPGLRFRGDKSEIVFIYYFAHIPQPFAPLGDAFGDHPDLWLSRCVSEACQDAASPEPGGGPGAYPTTVSVGPVTRGEGSSTVPIRVESGVAGVPFTHLEADVEIGEVGPSQTQLTLRGSYRAPLSSLDPPSGGLRHRRAEAIAKGIVERIASRLTSPDAVGHAVPPEPR